MSTLHLISAIGAAMIILWNIWHLKLWLPKLVCLLIGHRINWNFHVDVMANTSSSWEHCTRCKKRWAPGKHHHKYFSWR